MQETPNAVQRVAAYLRVSTDEQKEFGMGDQRKRSWGWRR